MMDMIKFDIDKLLETTSHNQEEDLLERMKKVEIDHLLEKTKDW